jgi:alkylation response protein AidB-like acyl-CoA dehydrogenase
MTETLAASLTIPRFAEASGVDAALARFRPIFARISAGAVEREQKRELPFEQIAWLRQARFGALRVPIYHGGFGLDHTGFLRLLIELAEADPNVAHSFRGHFAVVEEKLSEPHSPSRSRWLDRLGRGEIVGNASTEPGEAVLGKKSTRLRKVSDGWRLDGIKFYTTGSIFADWIDVSAGTVDDEQVAVLVRRDQAGVAIADDWDGFGQRLTGTGTAVFDDAFVDGDDVKPREKRLAYIGGIYQVVLLATLVGIARSIVTETASLVRERTRVYSHGNADLARDDAQIKQVVGEIAASAFAAEALVLATAPGLDAAHAASLGRDREAALSAARQAVLTVSKAQIAIAGHVLPAATHLFDALGASAVRLDNGLDRHWRNARVILSHNPLVYRARVLGDYVINGKLTDLAWSVGVADTSTKGATA